jgi:hypothetical protein
MVRAPIACYCRSTTFFGPSSVTLSPTGRCQTLFAATSPQAKPAGYHGPNGFYELKGPSVLAKIMSQATDAAVAARLWDISAALTGASFDQFAATA